MIQTQMPIEEWLEITFKHGDRLSEFQREEIGKKMISTCKQEYNKIYPNSFPYV